MSETRIVSGNIPADVALVTCDQETVIGTGSISNPLRAGPQATVGIIQRLVHNSVAPYPEIDVNADVVMLTGASTNENPGRFHLGPGEIDGHRLLIVQEGQSETGVSVIMTDAPNNMSALTITSTANAPSFDAASFTLVWSAVLEQWLGVAFYNFTILIP